MDKRHKAWFLSEKLSINKMVKKLFHQIQSWRTQKNRHNTVAIDNIDMKFF